MIMMKDSSSRARDPDGPSARAVGAKPAAEGERESPLRQGPWFVNGEAAETGADTCCAAYPALPLPPPSA